MSEAPAVLLYTHLALVAGVRSNKVSTVDDCAILPSCCMRWTAGEHSKRCLLEGLVLGEKPANSEGAESVGSV